MRLTTSLTGLTLASLLLLAGCGDREVAAGNEVAALPADAAELAAASDGQWLSLSGTIVSAAPDAFVLDYGAGNVTVEMDDWDWYQEGRALKPGDRVTVSGLADQDMFLKKRIEARSVYVRNINSFFFASSADEEEFRARGAVAANADSGADFTGTVTSIEGREFTLGTGRAAIRVDTSSLPDNPLDGEGLRQVRVGDRVFVWGDVDLEVAENAELKARGLISLVRNQTASAGAPAGSDAPVDNQAQPGNQTQPTGSSSAVTNDAVPPTN